MTYAEARELYLALPDKQAVLLRKLGRAGIEGDGVRTTRSEQLAIAELESAGLADWVDTKWYVISQRGHMLFEARRRCPHCKDTKIHFGRPCSCTTRSLSPTERTA